MRFEDIRAHHQTATENDLNGALADDADDRWSYLQFTCTDSSVGAPNRREINYGLSANDLFCRQSLTTDDCAFSIRVESLITESCGSASMASVCGGTLVMTSAQVSHVADRLTKEADDDEPILLTDILGIEDTLESVDFDVGGGDDAGISAFELDVERVGLSPAIRDNAVV